MSPREGATSPMGLAKLKAVLGAGFVGTPTSEFLENCFYSVKPAFMGDFRDIILGDGAGMAPLFIMFNLLSPVSIEDRFLNRSGVYWTCEAAEGAGFALAALAPPSDCLDTDFVSAFENPVSDIFNNN